MGEDEQDSEQGAALIQRGILDPTGLRRLLRHQKRPWIDFGSHLWALLFLEHWARQYAA